MHEAGRTRAEEEHRGLIMRSITYWDDYFSRSWLIADMKLYLRVPCKCRLEKGNHSCFMLFYCVCVNHCEAKIFWANGQGRMAPQVEFLQKRMDENPEYQGLVAFTNLHDPGGGHRQLSWSWRWYINESEGLVVSD